MNMKIEGSKELSIDEIEEVIKKQTSRVNRGLAWLVGGILVTIVTLGFPIQIVAWGAILYGLAEIINGSSNKSKYKKMLPIDLLPAEIECIKCGKSLELDMDERTNQKYFCPICNQSFRYPLYRTQNIHP